MPAASTTSKTHIYAGGRLPLCGEFEKELDDFWECCPDFLWPLTRKQLASPSLCLPCRNAYIDHIISTW